MDMKIISPDSTTAANDRIINLMSELMNSTNIRTAANPVIMMP
jgi:hypothetical protein